MHDLALIFAFPTVGATELIILLAIILLIFGAKRIPELAKGLGTGVREFKKGTSGEELTEDSGNLPQGDAARNGKVPAEEASASVEQAGQRR